VALKTIIPLFKAIKQLIISSVILDNELCYFDLPLTSAKRERQDVYEKNNLAKLSEQVN